MLVPEEDIGLSISNCMPAPVVPDTEIQAALCKTGLLGLALILSVTGTA